MVFKFGGPLKKEPKLNIGTIVYKNFLKRFVASYAQTDC